jgi:hypothetical protein
MENGWDRATILTAALASAFALIIGAAVGFVTTFTHRQAPPWGLIAGLLVVAALVAGFRLVFDSRAIAAAAGIGAVAATAILTLPGAGGTAFIVDDPIGWAWALGPAVLAAVLVLWPRRRRRRMDT